MGNRPVKKTKTRAEGKIQFIKQAINYSCTGKGTVFRTINVQ